MTLDQVFAGLTALGVLGTGVGILIGLRQVKAAEGELEQTKLQAQTSFEDDLSREYRTIVGALPPDAFYRDGQIRMTDDMRSSFYRYFDLSNEQLFLARLGRVSDATAEQWRDGVAGNLELPAFKLAWAEILPRLPSDFFEELRRLAPAPRS